MKKNIVYLNSKDDYISTHNNPSTITYYNTIGINNVYVDNTAFRDLSTDEKLHDVLLIKSNQSLLKDNFKDCMDDNEEYDIHQTNKSACLLMIDLIDDILELNNEYKLCDLYTKDYSDEKILNFHKYLNIINNLLDNVDMFIYKFAGYNFFFKLLKNYKDYTYSYGSCYALINKSKSHCYRNTSHIPNEIEGVKFSNNLLNSYNKNDRIEFMKEIGKLLILFLKEFKYNLGNEKCLSLSDFSKTKSASKIN